MNFRGSRVLGLLVVPAILLGGLTACGGDEDAVGGEYADYCAKAKQYQEIFADDGTGLSLVNNLTKLKRLADLAPEDMKDEWQTFLAGLEGLDAAIRAVGLKPTDFHDAEPPLGIADTERALIATAADRLAQDDVVSAATGIEQQAKDVCKLQLGL